MFNMFTDKNKNVLPAELSDILHSVQNNAVLVDVRTPAEFAGGSIIGAMNIPIDELDRNISVLAQREAVYLFCHSGGRSRQAYELLVRRGIENVKELQGGIIAWVQAGLPTTR